MSVGAWLAHEDPVTLCDARPPAPPALPAHLDRTLRVVARLHPATLPRIAGHLDVSLAQAEERVTRLRTRGLVVASDGGFRLTTDGKRLLAV